MLALSRLPLLVCSLLLPLFPLFQRSATLWQHTATRSASVGRGHYKHGWGCGRMDGCVRGGRSSQVTGSGGGIKKGTRRGGGGGRRAAPRSPHPPALRSLAPLCLLLGGGGGGGGVELLAGLKHREEDAAPDADPHHARLPPPEQGLGPLLCDDLWNVCVGGGGGIVRVGECRQAATASRSASVRVSTCVVVGGRGGGQAGRQAAPRASVGQPRRAAQHLPPLSTRPPPPRPPHLPRAVQDALVLPARALQHQPRLEHIQRRG